MLSVSFYFSWNGSIYTHSGALWELVLVGPRTFLLGYLASLWPLKDTAKGSLQEVISSTPVLSHKPVQRRSSLSLGTSVGLEVILHI